MYNLRFESINHNKCESINNAKSLCITQKRIIAFWLGVYCQNAISTDDDHLSFEIFHEDVNSKTEYKTKYQVWYNLK